MFHIESRYIEYDGDIKEEASRIHGITSDFLRTHGKNRTRCNSYLIDQLYSKSHKPLVCCWNTQFDISMIRQILIDNNKKEYFSKCDYIDACTMFHSFHQDEKHSLNHALEFYKTGFKQDHNALSDAYYCMYLFSKMYSECDYKKYINVFRNTYINEQDHLPGITYKDPKDI